MDDLLGFGGKAFILWLIFFMCREAGESSRQGRTIVYFLGFLCFAGLALFSRATYGTHVEDSDPMFSGGEVVEDFRPHSRARNEHGIVVFIYLSAAGFAGLATGLRARAKAQGIR